MVCPKCKADRAHRSHRRGPWENVVGLFSVHPYRCHGCEHRFLRFRYADGPRSGPASGAEREVRATRRSIQWRRKRREILLYGLGFLLFLAFLYYITRPHDSAGEGNAVPLRILMDRHSFYPDYFPSDSPNAIILNIKSLYNYSSVSFEMEILKEYTLTMI